MDFHVGTIGDLINSTACDRGARLSGEFLDALSAIDASGFSPAHPIRSAIAVAVVGDPELFVRSFRRHGVAELATSQTLDAVAATLKPTELKVAILAHAEDERRHSRMFAALANRAAPFAACGDDDNEWVLDIDRRFVETYNGDVIEFVSDLVAGEVRSFFYLQSYVEAIESARPAYAAKADTVLRQIIEDERRHIGYTAGYLDEWLRGGLDIRPSMAASFRNFDVVTWADVAATARHFMDRFEHRASGSTNAAWCSDSSRIAAVAIAKEG